MLWQRRNTAPSTSQIKHHIAESKGWTLRGEHEEELRRELPCCTLARRAQSGLLLVESAPEHRPAAAFTAAEEHAANHRQ